MMAHVQGADGRRERAAARREAKLPATNEVAIIKTSLGTFVAELWSDVAPRTVENFKFLANTNFYDGTAFHRVVKGALIQGGDPLTKDRRNEAQFGMGGPGYAIRAEFNERAHVRGVLSMARAQEPDSAGSQFFIVLGDAPHFDRHYTAFGKVIRGDDVLGKIGEVPVGPNQRGERSLPLTRIDVHSIRVVSAASLE